MRIGSIRMPMLGWLCFGWAILAVWFLFQMFKGAAVLFLSLMRGLDRYNRRRKSRTATRNAYQRNQARQRAFYAPAQYAPVQSRPRPRRKPDPADYTPQWQSIPVYEPQDDPNWQPRNRNR